MFLQVGRTAINVHLIVEVNLDLRKGIVTVTMASGDDCVLTFAGKQCDQFLEWWDEKADVYRCPEIEEAPF